MIPGRFPRSARRPRGSPAIAYTRVKADMIRPNCRSLRANSFLIGSATTDGIDLSKKLRRLARNRATSAPLRIVVRPVSGAGVPVTV